MDNRLNIVLELNSDINSSTAEEYENNYQRLYKPLLTFLYTHPKFNFGFSFTGPQLEWLESKHPEAIDILSDLTSRRQVEVLGGGFYSPIFPLLVPVDRSGQIEKMTTELRSSIGKRPRGMCLFGSIWDPSLVTTIQSCGIEYIHLDSTLIPSAYEKFIPVIMSEQGKTVKIISVHKCYSPLLFKDINSWKNALMEIKNDEINQVVAIQFSIEEFVEFFGTAFFKELEQLSQDTESDFLVTTPQNYLKTARDFVTAYIPAGMEWEIAQWAKVPFEQCENQSHFPITIYDFLNTYSQNHRLYERMMYVSMLLSQCHGDKMRKYNAREKLWEAQSGIHFVNMPVGLPAVARQRQISFRLLNQTEKLIKEVSPCGESVTSFDYNGDGLNEFVCQMEKYHAVISLSGGSISELDVINTSGDYASSLSRVQKFDKAEDKYRRGIFVEHVLEKDSLKDYFKGNLNAQSFATVNFVEKKFENKRKEIQMEGRGLATSLNQMVSLRKNIIVSSGGFIVQYILKNESPFALKGYFVVESNFAQTNFTGENSQYITELIVNDEKREPVAGNEVKIEKDVSILQITDTADKTCFVLEPNEDAGFASRYLTFKRPENSTVKVASSTLVTSFFWEIDLAPGMEMEKTVNLSIVPTKKKNSRKS